MSLNRVISQRTYPGVGDLDECWILATYWAARHSRPGISLPSIYMFRRWAGVPDRYGPTGGDVIEIMRAASIAWPGLARKYHSPDWAGFMAELRRHKAASVALLSSRLPYALRFGFYGHHQVGVTYQAGVIYLANPLAPSGSMPQRIYEWQLRYAVYGHGSWIQAAVFAPPVTPIKYHAILPIGEYFSYGLSSGVITGRRKEGPRHTTATVACSMPATYRWPGHGYYRLVKVLEGVLKGRYIGAKYASPD